MGIHHRSALVVFVLGGMLAGCLLDAGASGTPCESEADCPVYFACSNPAEGARTCQPIGLENVSPKPGADGGNNPPAVSFSKDVQPILTTYCASCHSAALLQGGLDLSAVGVSYSMVDKASICDAQTVLVKAGDPQNSMLWRKLAGDDGMCGGVMPVGRALKDSDAEKFGTIEAWISQGALNN